MRACLAHSIFWQARAADQTVLGLDRPGSRRQSGPPASLSTGRARCTVGCWRNKLVACMRQAQRLLHMVLLLEGSTCCAASYCSPPRRGESQRRRMWSRGLLRMPGGWCSIDLNVSRAVAKDSRRLSGNGGGTAAGSCVACVSRCKVEAAEAGAALGHLVV